MERLLRNNTLPPSFLKFHPFVCALSHDRGRAQNSLQDGGVPLPTLRSGHPFAIPVRRDTPQRLALQQARRCFSHQTRRSPRPIWRRPWLLIGHTIKQRTCAFVIDRSKPKPRPPSRPPLLYLATHCSLDPLTPLPHLLDPAGHQVSQIGHVRRVCAVIHATTQEDVDLLVLGHLSEVGPLAQVACRPRHLPERDHLHPPSTDHRHQLEPVRPVLAGVAAGRHIWVAQRRDDLQRLPAPLPIHSDVREERLLLFVAGPLSPVSVMGDTCVDHQRDGLQGERGQLSTQGKHPIMLL